MSPRSLLFVPAKEKMLRKIGTLGSDAYIIDLEDSIEESDKEAALELVKRVLKELRKEKFTVIIRVNKERYLKEISELKRYDVTFMLPKYEKCSDYSELPEDMNFIALIETPLGIINTVKIASNPKISALAFGAEDFTASIGMENNFRLLQYPKSILVVNAKAFGKKVFDTPSFKLGNIEEFEQEVENAKALGFDGKMAINPKHIEFINKSFATANKEYIEKIIRIYEACGEAVQMIDGNIYEKMHINHFKKILKESVGN